jgi:tetratricopeptide (TPR) repeat protein
VRPEKRWRSHAQQYRVKTPRLVLVAIIILVIAGLATLDKFLANAQEAEVHRLAERSYADALRLRNEGKLDEAIEAFRKAHALERRDPEYELALVDALISAKKTDQAELLIRDALERQPNDGRANLLAARLMTAKTRPADAESYYHRAVYGDWPSDAAAHRVSARMELTDFLAQRGKQRELLAELLPLQEQARSNPAAEHHVAELFLAAGSPSHAADEYRALIKENPKDVEAYEGLGEAELQLGEYRSARDAFLVCAAQRPDDPSIHRRLELSNTLMELDPTPRTLTSMERYRRSLRILDLARSDLERCAANHPALDSEEIRQLLASADDMLAKQSPSGITDKLENALGLVEKIWRVRTKFCGEAVSPDEEPLRLIIEKMQKPV